MTPTALMFVVCHALADQGPLDINGFPVDGIKLDNSTCRNEIVQMYDQDDPEGRLAQPNFSEPGVCARMAMSETAHWEQLHPGWFVVKVKCPHPDGSFPGDSNA